MKIRLIVPNEYHEHGTHDTNMVPYQSAIADIAGGFTASQAIGGWKDDKGTLIVEAVTVFDVQCEKPAKGEPRAIGDFIRLARRIAQELSQECVYLEIDGIVDYIKADLPSQPVGR